MVISLQFTMSPYLIAILLSSVFGASNAIVEGEEASLGEIPYIVGIHPFSSIRLVSGGGALVEVGRKQFVLTISRVCHELMDMDAGVIKPGVTIYAGDLNDADNESEDKQRVTANRVVFTPDWDHRYNYPCILGLDGRFNYTDNIQPIPFPEEGQVISGDVLISGYGYNNTERMGTNVLRKQVLPVISEILCEAAFSGDEFTFQEDMFCARAPEQRGRGSCVGDRGGPVVPVGENYLAGIIAFGRTCALRNLGHPDPYVDVSKHLVWIKRTADDL